MSPEYTMSAAITNPTYPTFTHARACIEPRARSRNTNDAITAAMSRA